VATAPTKLMTFAEFQQLPEDGRRYQLHHGELVTTAEPIWQHYDFPGGRTCGRSPAATVPFRESPIRLLPSSIDQVLSAQ
jgi:hypothetical protein